MYVCMFVCTYIHEPTRNAYETCERVLQRDDPAGTMRDRATFGQPERVPRVRSQWRTGPDLGKFFAGRSTRLGNSSGEEERRQEAKVARTAIVTGGNKQKDRLNKKN